MIDNLPPEILDQIIYKLSKKDLKNFSKVCKIFNKVSKRFLDAENLREYLEDRIFCSCGCDWRTIFEPRGTPRVVRPSRSDRIRSIVSSRSRVVDALTLS